MKRGDYQLTDRYELLNGTVLLSGTQALARIAIDQLRLDRLAGLNTAAFVSGYPGSPLGGLDQELARALRIVPDLVIKHLPAVNEELGASAVMGSQLSSSRPDALYDGVVGIWYGKAPGLDRATDALRHGVFAGSSSRGGALALVGDDPAAKSSTMPSSSDAALVDLHMPILYPATVAECLELGLHGIAMSRATGLWSALKIVTPVADGTGTVDLPALRTVPSIPTVEIDGSIWKPHPSAQFLGPRMVAVEQEFHEVRSDLARRYGIENALNQITTNPTDAWIGIVSTGYTYTQVLDALHRLGLSSLDQIGAAGIRLLHLRMPVPFDTAQIVEFAGGLKEILVVEEKNPTLERLVRDCLYDAAVRPRVVGKFSENGSRLLPSHGLLDADHIAPAVRARLEPVLGQRLAPPVPARRELIPLSIQRTPFFCSGCPHNWGTKVPEGAVVGMGTGCHGMTLLMDPERVGESIGITAMGNEGAHWLGMADFVETNHVFQNFGDGTYFHSGQLAIQAAIGAGANVTYKILYNSTVAMTGGQTASHSIGPADLAAVLLTHGVREVAITTDDVAGYRTSNLPKGVVVRDRIEIVAVQERLAKVPGVTVLINDQECAAELRRSRKRGTTPVPSTRVVINHRICEGCGDCGDVSNCLSVQPVMTPLGRKTQIDQNSCNFDFSCLNGDCPAFMTVELSETRSKPVGRSPDLPIPDPPRSTRESTTIRLSGIGGTGVVTAAQILGTAATIAGMTVVGLDQTGLSQKAGPVISDLTISEPSVPQRSNLIGSGRGDVLMAFDGLVAASDAAIEVGKHGHTAVVMSQSTTPTGHQISHPETAFPDQDELVARLVLRSEETKIHTLDSVHLASALTGTPASANMLMVGVALQTGEIPIPVEAVERAIQLNGVGIEANIEALNWGRSWIVDPSAVTSTAAEAVSTRPRTDFGTISSANREIMHRLNPPTALAAVVEDLASDLTAYQDDSYATRYLHLVSEAYSAGGSTLAESVAQSFHRLMAYKDEYEVARLMLSTDGLAPARAVSNDSRDRDITWHLHPPLLRAIGVKTKIRFGSRSRPLFAVLARGKRIRGTRLDLFGYTHLRRLERTLRDDFESAMGEVFGALQGARDELRVAEATAIAAMALDVRGFEDLKIRRATEYQREFATAVEAFSTA